MRRQVHPPPLCRGYKCVQISTKCNTLNSNLGHDSRRSGTAANAALLAIQSERNSVATCQTQLHLCTSIRLIANIHGVISTE